jgi:hypothetical protein
VQEEQKDHLQRMVVMEQILESLAQVHQYLFGQLVVVEVVLIHMMEMEVVLVVEVVLEQNRVVEEI